MNGKISLAVTLAFIIALSSFIPFYEEYRVPNVWEINNDPFFQKISQIENEKLFIIGGSAVGQLNSTYINKVISDKFSNYTIYNLAYNADIPTQRLNSLESTIFTNPKIVFYGISYWSLSDYYNIGNSNDPLQSLFKNIFEKTFFLHKGDLADSTSIYRIINKNYANIFEKATETGLFKKLVDDKMLVNFEDSSELELNDSDIFKIIKQEKIKFISFPYEWSFDMLKDAALMTLEIQKKCIEFGFSLKDASAYNIQFHNGKPILIDITSFEEYREEPWIAYRQFCEHFLGPLALMAKKDVRLSNMLVNYIDGIPLDVVSNIIPKTTIHQKKQKI